MQDISKAFNNFNCKVLRSPLNWRVTVISLSLCSGLVDYTCSNLIFLFGATYHILLFCTQHSILERDSILLYLQLCHSFIVNF